MDTFPRSRFVQKPPYNHRQQIFCSYQVESLCLLGVGPELSPEKAELRASDGARVGALRGLVTWVSFLAEL